MSKRRVKLGNIERKKICIRTVGRLDCPGLHQPHELVRGNPRGADHCGFEARGCSNIPQFFVLNGGRNDDSCF